MTTTVYVPYNTVDEKIRRIEGALKEVALQDPNWNGEKFFVSHDDYVWVETENEVNGAALIYNVVLLILEE